MIKFSEGTVIYNDRAIIENIELSTKINGKNYNVETKNTEISDDTMKIFFECQETGTKAELVLKKQGDSFTMHFMGKIIQKEVYWPIETVDEEEAYTLEMTVKTQTVFSQDICRMLAGHMRRLILTKYRKTRNLCLLKMKIPILQ